MTKGFSRGFGVAALLLAVAISACNDPDPQSPGNASERASLVSGTVVSDRTAEPAAGTVVDLERCPSGMMMSHHWHHAVSVTTDVHGEFHFEYMHESMHHYRVRVHGTTNPQGMCDVSGGHGQSIVLHIP